jgi:hypothetical protein
MTLNDALERPGATLNDALSVLSASPATPLRGDTELGATGLTGGGP